MSRLLAILGLLGLGSALTLSAQGTDPECAENSATAAAIRTTADVKAFVICAYEYVQQAGFEEARRAFNEDARWNHGPYYVFVDGVAETAHESVIFVYPPEPSLEGSTWGQAVGDLVDGFGTNVIAHDKQVLDLAGRGWAYAKFRNPVTGIEEPKASYVIRLEWEGSDAFIGAGIYLRDRPGTCYPEQVNALILSSQPSSERLEEFVRCAAARVEAMGLFSMAELQHGNRWRARAIYVFGVDENGKQVFSGNPLRVEGAVQPEWDSAQDLFAGRDVSGVVDAFGEAYLYYRSVDPVSGDPARKVAFVKRVLAHGDPLLIGSGYYVSETD